MIDGYTKEQVGYHVYHMDEAGLIDVIDMTSMHGKTPEGMPKKITWQGHEFIDAARSDTIWNKAMQKVKDAGGAVTFSALTGLLKKLVEENLGL